MTQAPQNASAAVATFLERYLEDCARSGPLPMEAYFTQLPGYERVIRKEYEWLQSQKVGGAENVHLQRIEHYELLGELGRGGQGVVHLAYDTRLMRRVAIKSIATQGSVLEGGVQRFQRTAELASKLEHPNICRIYDYDLDEGGNLFLVMELIEGSSLADILAGRADCEHLRVPPRGPRELKQVLSVIEKAARGLHHAHASNVLHRDVKPGNILVEEGGRPVLLDFGLARDLEHATATLTAPGLMLGTVPYMPPELVSGADLLVDARADVYSLGAVLYECLTGSPPFTGHSRAALMLSILEKSAPDLRAKTPIASRELQAVIETALEKDISRRYQSALEFADELERLILHEPVLARQPSSLRKLRRWCQRKPQLAASLFTLLIVLVSALTIALHLLGQVSAERDHSDWSAYTAGLIAADGSLRLADGQGAKRILDSVPPALANWEFAHLTLRSDPSIFTLEHAGAMVLPWSQPGQPARVLTATREGDIRLINPDEEGTNLEESALLLGQLAGGIQDLAGDSRHGWFAVSSSQTGRIAVMEPTTKSWLEISDEELSWDYLAVLGSRTLVAARQGRVSLFEFSLTDNVPVRETQVTNVRGKVTGLCATFRGDRFAILSSSKDPALDFMDVRTTESLDTIWRTALYGAGLTSASFDILAADFSPDGLTLAVVAVDRFNSLLSAQIQLHSSASGELLARRELDVSAVSDVAYSNDGTRILVACSDKSLRIFDAGLNAPEEVLLGNSAVPNRSSFFPDDTLCASSNANGEVKIFRSTNGDGRITIPKRPETTTSLAFSADGTRLVAGAETARLQVWDVKTGLEVDQFETGSHDLVTFGSDGHSVSYATNNVGSRGTPAISNTGSRGTSAIDDLCKKSVATEVALGLNSNAFAWTCPSDAAPWVQLGMSGPRLPMEPMPEDAKLSCLQLSGDGATLVGGSQTGSVFAWDTASGRLKWFHQVGPGPLRGLAVSRDGLSAAVFDADRGLRQIDANGVSGSFATIDRARRTSALAFSPDGQRLASASTEGDGSVVRIWDTRNHTMLLALRGMADGVTAVAWSPDGNSIAAGGDAQEIIVWTLVRPELHRDGALSIPRVSREFSAFDGSLTRFLSVFSDPVCQRWAAERVSDRARIAPHDFGLARSRALALYRLALLGDVEFAEAREALEQVRDWGERSFGLRATWIPRILIAGCLAFDGETTAAIQCIASVEKERLEYPQLGRDPLLEEVRIAISRMMDAPNFIALIRTFDPDADLREDSDSIERKNGSPSSLVLNTLGSLAERSASQLEREAWIIARSANASRQDYERAMTLVRAARRKEDRIPFQETLALIQYRLGDWSRCQVTCRTLIENFPEKGVSVLPTCHALLTLCALEQNDLSGARAHFVRLQVAQLSPRNAANWRPSPMIEEANLQFRARDSESE